MNNQNKKSNKTLILISASIITILLVVGIFMNINIEDTAMSKRKAVEAQQEVTIAYFDNMHKSISQSAGVATENMKQSKEAFKEIFISMMEKRYKDGQGQMMLWVKENNPDFDLNATSKLYEKLQNMIESKRDGFFMENKKLISINQSYETYCEKTINNWFLDDYSPIEIMIVTSSKTKEAFITGEENDINLFD